MIRALLPALLLALSEAASADTVRVATFNAELVREGPGLLLRDILRGGDPQVDAVVRVVSGARPDILVLQGVDMDGAGRSVAALADRLRAAGLDYPHVLGLPSNRGLHSGLDLDGDGRAGGPADSQGYGAFTGQGAMAVLSRFPIDRDGVQDFTGLAWADLPGADLPVHPDGAPFPSAAAQAAQRLSSTGHWAVPVEIAPGRVLSVLAFHAGPPVFDGPEDRNGRRNADEIRFWRRFLDGAIGTPPAGSFVIAGSFNLDPVDGAGRRAVLAGLLADPRIADPAPESPGAALAPDQGHRGPNARDTVDWPPPGPGRLRVDHVLPSADLGIAGSGVVWPAPGAADHAAAMAASRHRLVWVDLRF